MRFSILVIAFISSNLLSQNIDGYLLDALRYSSDDKITNTRSAGLGFSYLGILNDQGAIQFNPSGLTLNSNSEITSGVNYNSNTFNSEFHQTQNSNTFSSLNLTNFGVSSPVETYQNSEKQYYLGISYSNSANYNRNIDINTFNPNYSYTYFESLAKRRWTESTNVSNNGFTFINDSLQQNYNLYQ